MNFRGRLFLVSLFLLIFSLPSVRAQKLKKADRAVMERLSTHINSLSGQDLSGPAREAVVYQYVCTQFQKNGIEPRGDTGSYFHHFDIPDGMEMTPASFLYINGDMISKELYFPLSSSSAIILKASPSLALKESGEPWFIDLKEDLEAKKDEAGFDIHKLVMDQAKEAASKGATALFLYNTSAIRDNLAFDPKEPPASLPVPVIYISRPCAVKYFTDETAMVEIKTEIRFSVKKHHGQYLVGYINNHAPHTIMIATNEKADNAAALIEIGNLLKSRKSGNNNYILIAFFDQELSPPGLEPSRNEVAMDIKKANYLIDMNDKAGTDRLNYIYTIVEKAK